MPLTAKKNGIQLQRLQTKLNIYILFNLTKIHAKHELLDNLFSLMKHFNPWWILNNQERSSMEK
jgi:hypothetical protein